MIFILHHYYFFSSRRRHTRWPRDWSSDVCSSDLRKGTQQYQDQIEQLGTQKARLEDAKRELQRINDLADKTVYDKRINISTSPNIQSINDILARPVNKRVNVAAGGAYATYADGTPSGGHPGGLFLAGEDRKS